jgi:hypothetical protein
LFAFLAFALGVVNASHAHAQPSAHTWRVFLDTDLVSYDWVETTQRGARTERTSVVSVGPNQLGASRLWLPTAPVGFGLGYLIHPRWLIDLRAGFGFDALVSDGDEATPTFVAWSFMPGLSWLPTRTNGKFYLKFSPVLDFVQAKQGRERQRYFGGCFSLGAGTFLFTGEHASADIGLFFEGRFPDLDKKPANVKVEYTDLRGVVRIGLSLWR